ncbi:uncharacterized protein LOC143233582 [Tachypleus tridentatus]|uniref:uncharacterized protein LOC143233582 n=1 Tax=Tachypleus tridentatus TaxID=6853 RepID=UPI003FD25E69
MNRPSRLSLVDVNPYLTCVLCGGYFVDATTVTECLHSFCKTCIVRYLDTNKFCPICEVQVHKTRPLLNIRADKTLQDIVYKLVPGLFQNEMKRRRDFYSTHPIEDACVTSHEDRGELTEQREIYSPEDTISLSLEYGYGKNQIPTNGHSAVALDPGDGTKSKRRFLRCPAAVTVAHLKKFVTMKYSLGQRYLIDIMYYDESLRDDYTLMDIAYIYTWKRNGPMRLFYKIMDPPTERIKTYRSTCIQTSSNSNDRETLARPLFNINNSGIETSETEPTEKETSIENQSNSEKKKLNQDRFNSKNKRTNHVDVRGTLSEDSDTKSISDTNLSQVIKAINSKVQIKTYKSLFSGISSMFSVQNKKDQQKNKEAQTSCDLIGQPTNKSPKPAEKIQRKTDKPPYKSGQKTKTNEKMNIPFQVEAQESTYPVRSEKHSSSLVNRARKASVESQKPASCDVNRKSPIFVNPKKPDSSGETKKDTCQADTVKLTTVSETKLSNSTEINKICKPPQTKKHSSQTHTKISFIHGEIEKHSSTSKTKKYTKLNKVKKIVSSPETKKVVSSTETEKHISPVETGNTVYSTETRKVVSSTETEKHISPTETKKVVSSTETEKVVSSTETEKHISPTETKKVVSSTETEKHISPTETKKVVSSTETEKHISPTETKKVVSSTETEKHISPTETKKVVSSTETEKRTSPTETTKVVQPSETGKIISSTKIEKVSSPVETEKVTHLTDSRKVLNSTEIQNVSSPAETTHIVSPTETRQLGSPVNSEKLGNLTKTNELSSPTEVSKPNSDYNAPRTVAVNNATPSLDPPSVSCEGATSGANKDVNSTLKTAKKIIAGKVDIHVTEQSSDDRKNSRHQEKSEKKSKRDSGVKISKPPEFFVSKPGDIPPIKIFRKLYKIVDHDRQDPKTHREIGSSVNKRSKTQFGTEGDLWSTGTCRNTLDTRKLSNYYLSPPPPPVLPATVSSPCLSSTANCSSCPSSLRVPSACVSFHEPQRDDIGALDLTLSHPQETHHHNPSPKPRPRHVANPPVLDKLRQPHCLPAPTKPSVKMSPVSHSHVYSRKLDVGRNHRFRGGTLTVINPDPSSCRPKIVIKNLDPRPDHHHHHHNHRV